MSLHLTPERHDADPPSAWEVVKVADGCWHLDSSEGWTISYHTTKREAEAAKVSGPHVSLYEQEGRWFAGELVAGWRPYVECKARMDRAAGITESA